MERLEPDAVQLPINAVRVPDFEPEVLPTAAEDGVAGAWDRWDIPSWTDYIHYALSLPIAAATIGIDSYFTLDGVVAAAS